jgi:hypothetical protein
VKTKREYYVFSRSGNETKVYYELMKRGRELKEGK